MQAALLLDEPAWNDRRTRLAVCMAISTLVLFLVLTTLEWPARFELPWQPAPELEVTIRRPPEPGTREMPPPPAPAEPAETAEPAVPAVAQPAAPRQEAEAEAEAEQPAAPERGTALERPVVATQGEAPAARVDWYAELERAAAEVGGRAAAEPQSMHPEFDELRRIAALRYGEAQTKPPALAWGWEVEKDPSGQTLLKRGNTYMILEDRRLFNQYAFETFEKHMVFVAIPLGKRPPKNLPWVETIRARYDYFLEPDELPPLKVVPARAEP